LAGNEGAVFILFPVSACTPSEGRLAMESEAFFTIGFLPHKQSG